MRFVSRISITLMAAGFSLLSYAQEGKPLVQLSLNENPFGPAKGVLEAISGEVAQIARYTGHEGTAFIAAVAKQEGVDADQIITGEILQQLGIFLGIAGGEGSEFVYTVPGYPVLVNAAASVGGKVIEVPLNEHLENDLPAIEAKINERTKAVFLVNPHNPSGTVSDKEGFRRFLHRVSSKALIIVDEAYLEYSDDFAGRTAVANVRQGDNVLVFRTFAKAYGLAGLGLGYAVATKEVAAFLREQGLGNPHDLNRLSIAAAAAVLEDRSFIPHVKEVVGRERQKWTDFLDKLGLAHTASQANFVYFDTGKPYSESEIAFKGAGIAIGRAFAPYHTWIRISIGLPGENERARAVVKKLVAN